MKNQVSTFVEVKRVTWSKDSHGLFDYESKNVNFSKDRVESSSKVFKDGNEIEIKPIETPNVQMDLEDPNYMFSIIGDGDKNEKFLLKVPPVQQYDSSKQNLFLIVRSLKNEEGVQRGYTLELGDILRLGRIEYKVIEYQDSNQQKHSLFDAPELAEDEAFSLITKSCTTDVENKHQCRICFMDRNDVDEELVNPCSCKGTSEYVHIKCLQSWINSKVKNKVTADSSCWYWKHLSCEVCKTSLPDLIQFDDKKVQLVPTCRPNTPYMLLERIFYDKSKGVDNSKMLILLSISHDNHQIRLGRGHDCDLRENDISVSRLHAFIKYKDSKFVIVDNNSKFGTLILLRKHFEIEKRKIAVQLGRTVITFSLKQSVTNAAPTFKNPILLEKSWQPPKDIQSEFDKETQDFNLNDDNLSE